MIDKIRRYIYKNNLLDSNGMHLVGVSGGADSVCLLHVLKRLGYNVEAVHCNFKLRGEESERDEAFVKDLCHKQGVKLHITHFDTTFYASLHGVSIEMAARQLRYDYFEQLRHDTNASSVCVAHHQDDSVETVMMNLIRGTGIKGLTGIKPLNGHIVRPLLCVSRSEIEEWLKAEGIDYITDSTNLVPDVTRNKIRLEILPLLDQITPSASSNILTTARRVNEAFKVYSQSIKETLGKLIINDSIDISALQQQPSPESLLYEWLSPMGFTGAVIESISDTLSEIASGKQWHSPTHILTVNKGRLLAGRRQESEQRSLRIPETGTYISGNVRIQLETVEGRDIVRGDKDCVSLDASKVAFPLTLRPYSHGDRFCPFGMRGSKTVSDYLTDIKANLFERSSQLVVTDVSDRIIWLVSQRPDNRFRVTESTAATLIIKVSHL